MILHRRSLCTAICFCLLLTAGCAGMRMPNKLAQSDVSREREQRSKEAVRQFAEQRDGAEFEAAKARWEQEQDPQGCREILERLLARNPRHRDALLLLAELYLSRDESQSAYEKAKAALDIYPNDPHVQYTMGLAMDAQGQESDALGYFERAAKMAPNNELYSAAYQASRQASRDTIRRTKANSLETADSAPITIEDVIPTAYAGDVAPPDRTTRNDSAAVAKSADSAGNAGGQPAPELLLKGQAALVAGDVAAARETFNAWIATKLDNPQIPVSAAAAALRANQPDLAVELLIPAAKQFPNAAAIHRTLGAAQYRRGDYKSSQVALQQALSLDKSSALSYLLMGCTLAKLGQRESAEAHFRQARALDPRYSIVR